MYRLKYKIPNSGFIRKKSLSVNYNNHSMVF